MVGVCVIIVEGGRDGGGFRVGTGGGGGEGGGEFDDGTGRT